VRQYQSGDAMRPIVKVFPCESVFSTPPIHYLRVTARFLAMLNIAFLPAGRRWAELSNPTGGGSIQI
jgi:hypothetical protein